MRKLILNLILMASILPAVAHVNLIYPAGGESFSAGQEVEVEWEIVIPHDTENWDLYFSDDGGESWEVIALDISPELLTYNWLVPDEGTDAARVRVVQDNVGIDYEDESNNFSITATLGQDDINMIAENFILYPVPAKDQLFIVSSIQLRHVTINVIGMQGQLIERLTNAYISKNEPFLLKLEGVRPGIYYMQVIMPDGVLSKKFLVQ
jgi:hypothetical protein